MTEEVTATVAEEVVNKQPETAPVRDYEAEARDIGWLPEGEFKGDKARWKPAQKFVEDGENFIPILKANERKLRLELAKERSDFAARLEKLNRVTQTTLERQQQQHEQEIERLRAAKDTAVEAGDKAEVRKIDAQIDKLREPIAVDEPAAVPPDFAAFKQANPWYDSDKKLTAYATAYSDELATANPNITLADNLAQVVAHMREAFPERMGVKPKTNGHAAVDGGGSFSAQPSRSDPLSKLPNEARAQAKADMTKYPKVYPNAEAWIKVYEGKV